MNVREYNLKQIKKCSELLKLEPKNEIEQAINHLKMMICDIAPYSRSWRNGYIKSLRMAIKSLEK